MGTQKNRLNETVILSIQNICLKIMGKKKMYNCSRDRYITHFYCLAVEAGFYSDVVECLPLDLAAQVRFPPQAVGIFLHPVTFGGQCGAHGLCFGHHSAGNVPELQRGSD